MEVLEWLSDILQLSKHLKRGHKGLSAAAHVLQVKIFGPSLDGTGLWNKHKDIQRSEHHLETICQYDQYVLL
jgi:hypothetical protein